MIQNYKKGDIICREGEYEACMYHLLSGEVGIYAGYGTDGENRLTVLKATDRATFGEMGLLEKQPRSSTAVALEDVCLFRISEETFSEYFSENPGAVLLIMKNMSKSIRRLTGQYLDACRAVSEAVETEQSGRAKSRWFRKAARQFIRDFEEGLNYGVQQNLPVTGRDKEGE